MIAGKTANRLITEDKLIAPCCKCRNSCHAQHKSVESSFGISAERGGTFPLVDFQKGNRLVSLKTVDTTTRTWVSRMKLHIEDLGTRGATVSSTPAEMILDLRVQPGGFDAARSIESHGRLFDVNVLISEYP